MARQLEAAEKELWNQVAYVQRVARGIKAEIQRDWTLIQSLSKRGQIGAVGHEAAPLKIFEEGHMRAKTMS